AELNAGALINRQAAGRIYAPALEIAVLTERARVFVDGVAAQSNAIGDPVADVELNSLVVERSAGEDRLPHARSIGFLANAIHQATAAAATESERIGCLEDLDAIDVVQIAEVLHVVARAIDKEVGARAVAANNDLIAVAFALVDGDARDIADSIGDPEDRLV